MADTGWKSPTAHTGQIQNGEKAFSSNDDDASLAVIAGGTDQTRTHDYTVFGFGIPSNATIDGIEIRMEHTQTVNSGTGKISARWRNLDFSRFPSLKEGTISGSEHIDVVGGSTDLWGVSPIAEDFTDDEFVMMYVMQCFGFECDVFHSVDHIQVKVYYTPSITFTVNHTTDGLKLKIFNQQIPFGSPFLDSLRLPIPTGESMTPVWSTAEVQTIAGKDTRKLHSRKYSYKLVWLFMKPQDYTAMENKINELDVMTFTYRKYSQTENGVQVIGELSERRPVTRYPKQTYLSKVTLKLLEVNPR